MASITGDVFLPPNTAQLTQVGIWVACRAGTELHVLELSFFLPFEGTVTASASDVFMGPPQWKTGFLMEVSVFGAFLLNILPVSLHVAFFAVGTEPALMYILMACVTVLEFYAGHF